MNKIQIHANKELTALHSVKQDQNDCYYIQTLHSTPSRIQTTDSEAHRKT